MTRRAFISAGIGGANSFAAASEIVAPVHRWTDSRANCSGAQFEKFWSGIWPEAVRDLGRCGIQIRTSDGQGTIRRSAGDRPNFVGLRRGVLNLVLTDHIPMMWDQGRALAGVSTVVEGLHVSMVALRYAHGHQIPYVSVNTCVHEFLHVFLRDLEVADAGALKRSAHELRVDWLATRLWLFGDGREIRISAQTYVERLRLSSPSDLR